MVEMAHSGFSEALFSTKTNQGRFYKPIKVGFIFTGPNFLSRTENLVAVNHLAQAFVRVGSKIGP